MTNGQYRKDIENFLDYEETVLMQCVDLIKQYVPLRHWPSDVKTAFLLAVQLKGEHREAYKAYITCRHLRIDTTSLLHPPDNIDIDIHRCAERIRADLAHMVGLGAGKYLTASTV